MAVVVFAELVPDDVAVAEPAIRAVSLARNIGLENTPSNVWPARSLPRAEAWSSPSRVSRDVRGARVLARDGPLGLAVSDEPDRHALLLCQAATAVKRSVGRSIDVMVLNTTLVCAA